uniref:Uncharacterized protein n=1 Tax=Rhizophora mucronata TaxID=61149 RepID=A0A2P2NN18_RHIMU
MTHENSWKCSRVVIKHGKKGICNALRPKKFQYCPAINSIYLYYNIQ